MGRATRWLRALFGGKKADPDESPMDGRPAARGRRRWGFVMQFREKGQPPQRRGERTQGSYREAQRPFAPAAGEGEDEDEDEDEEEQNKRAIAVAAATAAVAEAAVAAAQAAAAVVRLTSSGRAAVGFAPAAAASKQEEAAAIKIQAAFRGYLARRALKALKGLVKLQALVRGNIVRKQASETLRCMQALVRVQARARACRVLRSERCRFEKAPSGHARIPSTSGSRDRASSGGWNWLDRWMEERYRNGRESVKKPGSSGGGCAPMDDEKSAKILEVDPGKPQFHHHKRRNAHNHSSCSTLTSDQNSHSFVTVPDSPSTESTAAQQLRLAAAAAEYSESPQFYSASSSRPGSSRRGPFTPNSKSECSRSLFSGYCDYPNYMANTESSRAKVRSHSAPKQRPADRPNPLPPPAAAPLAQRSSSLHAKFSNKAYPGSGRLDRLGMPIRI